jgi:hypothetical protein
MLPPEEGPDKEMTPREEPASRSLTAGPLVYDNGDFEQGQVLVSEAERA